MIRNLRRKFTAIAMTSMALVLSLIIAMINIANYRNVNQTADELLQILADSNGAFPKENRKIPPEDDEIGRGDKKPDSDNNDPDTRDSSASEETPSDDNSLSDGPDSNAPDNMPGSGETKSPPRKHSSLSAEAAYNTRFFTVTLNEDGSVYTIDTSMIHATSSSRAQKYATELYEAGKTNGFINHYKFTRITRTETGKTRYIYIFLDCEQELATFRNFLVASILISLAGLLVVFILVVIFSGIALKPVSESYAKQKRFITDASHEIKTPLTIIDANTEILEMMGEENEWTESIRRQIKRLTDLTEKMVFLSRMDEENTHLTMVDFSLSDAVTETVEPFLPVAQTKNRTLTLSVQPNISFHGDETNIRQLVSLLIDNALKYSSEPGDIRVTLKSSGRTRRLSVWNTVDGIEPGIHDELFDRFYRRDSSRNTRTGGHGIGLSVAQAIVLSHKGKITAKSEDGTSILFLVTLP